MKTIKNPTNMQIAEVLCKTNPNSNYASLLGYDKDSGKLAVKDLSLFTANPSIANEFLSDMYNQIVMQRTYDLFRDYEMPFKVFLREMSRLGDAEQLLTAELATVKSYSEGTGVGETPCPFDADKPSMVVSFIKTVDKDFTEVSLSYDIWAGAFVSEQGLSNMAGIIIKNLQDSIEEDIRVNIRTELEDDTLITKSEDIELVSDAGETANAQKAYEEIVKLVIDMSIPSDDYNTSEVKTYTRKGDAVLVLNSRYASAFDVNVLASLFNSGEIATKKYFAEVIVTDLTAGDDNLIGVVLDKEAYLYGFRFKVASSIFNPKTLKINIYNHAWIKRGLVPFRQAVQLYGVDSSAE